MNFPVSDCHEVWLEALTFVELHERLCNTQHPGSPRKALNTWRRIVLCAVARNAILAMARSAFHKRITPRAMAGDTGSLVSPY